MPRRLVTLVAALLVSMHLISCGGGGDAASPPPPPPPPPTAYDHEVDSLENTGVADLLDATDVDPSTATYAITIPAQFGLITIDQTTGDITYDPDPGFVGADDFYWEVSDQWGVSNTAHYVIDVGGIYAQVASATGVVASR